MLDSKFFITLIGLAVVLFAVSSKSFNSVTENFMNFARIGIASSERCKGNRCSSEPIDYKRGLQRFISNPSYEAVIPPRFMAGSYGAVINYNPPAQQHLALNKNNSLSFGNMAKCNYTQENFEPPKNKKMSYDQALQDVYKNDKFEDLSPNGIVNVNDMSTINSMGQDLQTYSYDRLIYSTAKSRLTGLGDPIRGDLPIIPNACGWFSPSVNPARDLTKGAINVIAGTDNETSRKLAELVTVATDFTAPAVGGVALDYRYATPQAMKSLINNSYNVNESQRGSTVGVDNENSLPTYSAMKTATGFA